MSKTPTLYRHFDSSGRLLYVGISLNLFARLHAHSKCSEWFHMVSAITVEHYGTPELMRAAERMAIETEKPIYNLAFTDRAKPKIRKPPSQEQIDAGRNLAERVALVDRDKGALLKVASSSGITIDTLRSMKNRVPSLRTIHRLRMYFERIDMESKR